jgi:uncharacterized membrane-anchored protein
MSRADATGRGIAGAAAEDAWAKVPQVTLGFWIVKILATTLGETGGDAVTMSMGLGYLAGTAIFAVLFAAAVCAQVRAARFQPWLYWTTIVASTTVGTTLADFADRSLGIGYGGGSALLLALLAISLATWRWTTGTVAVETVADARSEGFYWATIMFSQTLGTALGDWVADTAGSGYAGGIAIFGGVLALVAALRFFTRIPRAALFWAAFVATRPLGAVLGDFLDKPLASGGLAGSRYAISILLLGLMAAGVALLPQGPARRAH